MLRWLTIFAATLVTLANGLSIEQRKIPEFIQNQCYNVSYDRTPLILGQQQPNAQSLDNFLSLVEKIEDQLERDRRPMGAAALARLLLKRFHIDNLEYDAAKPLLGFSVHAAEKARIQIVSALLQDNPYEEFPENVLTPDEKCSMYFMLSHTVNTTLLPGETNFRYLPSQQQVQPDNRYGNPREQYNPQRGGQRSNIPVIPGGRAPSSTYQATSRGSTTPREQGVVSFKFNRDQTTAIAVNRVLLGVVAGALSGAEGTTPLSAIVQQTGHEPPQGLDLNGVINVLTAVTVADLLAVGVVDGSGKEMTNFGARGSWNDSTCTTEYRLIQDVNGTQATLAQLRGALDGYAIGRGISEITQRTPTMRLSTLLRLYYSPNGFGSQGMGASVCSRQLNELSQNLKQEATNFLKLYSVVDREGNLDDARIQGLINDYEPGFTNALRIAAQRSPEETDFCNVRQTGGAGSKYPCETRTDLFALIDTSTYAVDKDTREKLAEMISKMDIRQQGGSVSLLTTSMGTELQTPLMAFAYNSTNAGCPVCRTVYRDNRISGSPINDPAVMLQRLNETLMRFEEGKASTNAVPGKAVIYWNGVGNAYGGVGGMRKPDYGNWQFQTARRDLHLKHRDTLIIAISDNKEIVEGYVRNKDTDIFSPNDGNLVEKLLNRLCENPQVIQHPDCYQRPSSEDMVVGYVTPNYVQYWAMYPDSFLKSFGITIKFRAPNGLIRVCYDRYPRPETRDSGCQETKATGEELTYWINNPCKGETYETCAPFYFSVIGRQGGATQDSLCKDPGCKSGDQIRFEVTHSGVYCGSAIMKEDQNDTVTDSSSSVQASTSTTPSSDPEIGSIDANLILNSKVHLPIHRSDLATILKLLEKNKNGN